MLNSSGGDVLVIGLFAGLDYIPPGGVISGSRQQVLPALFAAGQAFLPLLSSSAGGGAAVFWWQVSAAGL